MKRTRTKEEIEEIARNNYSIASCLRAMGLRPLGANYKMLHKYLDQFRIDTSHFTGRSWSRGRKLGPSKRAYKLEDILVENSTYLNSTDLKKKLLIAGLKEHRCEMCGNLEWMGSPIPIEIDHINGKNNDNRIENLRIVCPNCHSLTPTYRGRNPISSGNAQCKIKFDKSGNTNLEWEKESGHLCSCGVSIHRNSRRCRECEYASRQSKCPPVFKLLEDFKELKSFVKVGEKYGVSDNAVRKWLTRYQLIDNLETLDTNPSTK